MQIKYRKEHMVWKDFLNSKSAGAGIDGLNILVDRNFVWDYKIQGETLRLISEPVLGSETYPRVTVGEISEYLGIFQDFELISETDGSQITLDRIELCN